MQSLVGFSLAGRYDVLELVGEGGMGAVYRVFDRELEEIVALKVIREELAAARGIVDRFRTEVKLARRVTHVNVARTFELGHAGDLMFCTMELVDGEGLRSVLARRGRLPVEELAAIACAMCDGLAAAHAAGVIHRDIKPDNVLVGSRVVLTDFGVAALVVDEGEIAGTVAYMAPEQMRGEPTTPAADIYAVGVVLYEMATGARAFHGSDEAIFAAKQSLARLVVQADGVPGALADVIARATERDPRMRISTATELAAALAPWRARSVPEVPHSAEARGMQTVVVPPPVGDGDKLYIAEAIHDRLLHRLARTPRVRVQVQEARHALRVELTAGDDLAVRTGSFTMRLPLAVEHVDTAAESIAVAVISALAPPARDLEASALLYQANYNAQERFARNGSSFESLERAAALAPEDPQIASALASSLVQRGFMSAFGTREVFARAAALVRIALANGPHLSDTHLAAGQLELHLGDPATAAGHLRVAIACAPHSATAHEYLGRMLLEAGHLAAGYARLDEAKALSPHLRSANWQIARAHALESEWDDAARMLDEIDDGGRLVAQMRVYTWRRDREGARRVGAAFAQHPNPIFRAMYAVVVDDQWAATKGALLAVAMNSEVVSLRTSAFVAQLVAELAALSGDDDAALAAVARATEHRLFDLHWLDRCELLAPLRTRSAWPALREPVARRADAILDALYGDHPVQAPEHTRAERPVWLDAPTRLG